MRADAAQDAEHGLDERRRLHQPAVDEVRQVVEVADVVALEFEARAIGVAERQDGFDVLIGVAEDQRAAVLQVFPFPVMLEVLEAVQHREQAEVHRPHVQRSQFGLEGRSRAHALFHRHVRAAAGTA
ncbi:hypothetical protein G6F31_019849 [Rhizopus arrhizus]|nr:hypothetical protein G6F31_019849 [Rhizopus arrhizus]